MKPIASFLIIALAQDPAALGKYDREILTLTKAALAHLKTLVPGSDGTGVK